MIASSPPPLGETHASWLWKPCASLRISPLGGGRLVRPLHGPRAPPARTASAPHTAGTILALVGGRSRHTAGPLAAVSWHSALRGVWRFMHRQSLAWTGPLSQAGHSLLSTPPLGETYASLLWKPCAFLCLGPMGGGRLMRPLHCQRTPLARTTSAPRTDGTILALVGGRCPRTAACAGLVTQCPTLCMALRAPSAHGLPTARCNVGSRECA